MKKPNFAEQLPNYRLIRFFDDLRQIGYCMEHALTERNIEFASQDLQKEIENGKYGSTVDIWHQFDKMIEEVRHRLNVLEE